MRDVDLSGLSTGVIGDRLGHIKRRSFAALATASPPNGGHVVGNQAA